MAIIYSYPTKATPVGADMVLITDSGSTNPANQTKQASISSIKDTIDVVDSLTAGAGISISSSTGNVTIANTGVLSLSSSFGTYISGTNHAAATGAANIGTVDLNAVDGTAVAATRFLSKDNTWDTPPTYTGGANIGYVTDGGSNTTFLRGDGTWVVPTNTTDITLTTTGTSGASTWDGTTLNIPQYSDGVDGSGTANQVPMWSDSDTLTDSIMKQVGTGVSAKLVIGGNPNNGLMFENTGTGIPDVTLLPFNGASGANWDMRLPAPPTTGGQIMSLPSTLGSSPYQLEWTTPTTGTGTQYNIPMFATTTTLGDSLLSQPSANNMVFGTSSLSGKWIDFKNHKIAFDSDNTNTFIMADTASPESLEIHADEDIVLKADNYVVVEPGIGVPVGGLDLGRKGSITFDANFLYIAIDDDDWRKVALSAI